MTEPEHSYGPTCAFYNDESDQGPSHDTLVPPVKAQFFYVSSLPIDDPLSPLPPVQAEKASQQPPQPFSARDNAALEEAWQGLRGATDGLRPSSRHKLERGMVSFPKFREGLRSQSPHTPSIEQRHISSNATLRPNGSRTRASGGRPSSELQRKKSASASPDHAGALTGSNGSGDIASSGQPTRPQRAVSKTSQPEVMLSQEMSQTNGHTELVDASELRINRDSATTDSKKRAHHSPLRRSPGAKTDYTESPTPGTPIQSYVQDEHSNDISGRPFARAPSARNISAQRFTQLDEHAESERAGRSRSKDVQQNRNDTSDDHERIYVPVGVSRLHLVELPDLLMQPIYWSPINDTSNVIRATWFYRDTMLPVPTNLANRLELGYEYIKPFAESYQDELQACIDNGASAELKVVHKLWDDKRKSSRPGTGVDKLNDELPEPPTLPNNDENAAAEPDKNLDTKRMFETHSVIYIDRKHAQILRPSLLPSVSQKRRPLNSVRKGRQIGVAVVRGFDRKLWMKLHPDPRMNATAAHAKVGAYMSQSGDATTRGRRMSCAACDERYNTPKVSDLVLVIHGIGQKLSERVDSFHFTHAINGLRRDFNVELSSEAVKGNLKSNTGMMVLPVNWRLTVSFDDGKEQLGDEPQNFGLKDITPETLPAVRSIISDVMLDIPYYMSHHKEKMTSAVIREANRVYRLWCRNNPGFRENGRVHVIAHSLGSVMAMEILSNQPTKVSPEVDFETTGPSDKSFEFNTTNLFCCGSPGGFFLLLNNARLVPRAGLEKGGVESESQGAGVTADPQYGCLAVENIYNVLNKNDPISYLLNASVDADYAASLQPANIPPASLSLFSRMGSSLRWTARITPDPYTSHKIPERPQVAHMPSTVELETHNFTREEVAEKRMYLLNENGQIDFHLASGGGPLEIQYLSMLSAHSSYWISRDFVRFLVVEIGRKSGKENTLPVLRAVKRREYKRGTLA